MNIYIIAILSLLLKIIIAFNFYDFELLNRDEDSNYKIALHYSNHGVYPETAFHGSGTIFLYEKLIKLNVSISDYLIFYFAIMHIFYFASIIWFYNLCKFFLKDKYLLYATIIYCIYPSILYFVGAYSFYENLATYLLIFNVLILLRLFNNKHIYFYELLLFTCFLVISCLLRSHLIPIYLCILIAISMLVAIRFNRNASVVKQFVFISLFTVVLFGLTHYPIFIKNEKIFGTKLLSTQFGFELLQGFNPTAKGSWMGNWKQSGNPLNEYIQENIPGIEDMNEYEESKARKELAIRWMLNNPKDVILLTIRKFIIYFIPKNYSFLPYSNIYNPVNAAIHLLFIFFVFQILLNRITLNKDIIIILLPVIGSILVSVILFVGYRWRIYAEPFMVLCSFISLASLFSTQETLKNSKNK